MPLLVGATTHIVEATANISVPEMTANIVVRRDTKSIIHVSHDKSLASSYEALNSRVSATFVFAILVC